MKKLIPALAGIAVLSFSSCCGCNGDHAGDAHHHDSTAASHDEYTHYGLSEITPDGAMTTTEMYAVFENTGAFNDKIAVNIDQVCQMAGCWITFKDDNGESVRVFFRDHFTIPVETAQDTPAILYGALVIDTLSVDFQKHLLDDARAAGEEIPQSEYDAITADKIERTFDCEAILVKNIAH